MKSAFPNEVQAEKAVKENLLPVEYSHHAPSLKDFSLLLDSTGWRKDLPPISDEDLRVSIDNTWHWCSAYDVDKIVGAGRVISDGSMYALVCDLIVLPDYRRRGIGGEILARLTEKCRQAGIKMVWLFSARGKSGFYRSHEFIERPPDAPGMQLKD